MSAPLGATELLGLVLDTGSFESWDEPIDVSGHPPEYRNELSAAAARAGTDESIITGRGRVRGRPVAVIANEFRFLGGSIGMAAAARIVAAVQRATAEAIPVLAGTASGGTRMQEGTPAFVRMIDITRELMRHKAAGLPYLVYLRHPTTGGVFASWGSLGHITVAEPGALIGFLGPKVYRLLNNRPFPTDVQTAENLLRAGIIDAIVSAEDLHELIDRALTIMVDPPISSTLARRFGGPTSSLSAWDSIIRTRSAARPGVREVLKHGGTNTIRLNGTEEGERDASMLIALTRLDGQPCVVIGQDRRRQAPLTPMGPAALREARRGMRLANELGLPLVAFIDTPGADLSADAEQGAIAGEIARCIGQMSTLTVPSVSVLLGQGSGGGALALLPATRVIAAEHAWLAPLPPEGASAILFGDVTHAAQLAEAQHVGSADLLEFGIVSRVIPEHPDDSPATFSQAVAAECGAQLQQLTSARLIST